MNSGMISHGNMRKTWALKFILNKSNRMRFSPFLLVIKSIPHYARFLSGMTCSVMNKLRETPQTRTPSGARRDIILSGYQIATSGGPAR